MSKAFHKAYIVICYVFFILTFILPKAGTKIGSFPLYLSVFVSLCFLFFVFFQNIAWRKVTSINIAFYTSILVCTLCIQFLVYENASMDFVLLFSTVIPLLSFYFVYFFDRYPGDLEGVVRFLGVAFWVLTLYGFAQKVIGDYVVVIPGVTANYAEAIESDFLAKKHNMIWGINYLKLTSTYQNGNLFGVNYVLISWFYFVSLANKGKGFALPLVASVFIILATASASVFIGYASACLIWYVRSLYRRPSIRSVFVVVFAAIIILGFGAFILSSESFIAEVVRVRLLERDWSGGGGRTDKVVDYWSYLENNYMAFFFGSMFDSKQSLLIYEVLFLSILQQVGILVLCLLAVLCFRKLRVIRVYNYDIAFWGYLVSGLADGAFWLPPTAVNFFLLLGLAVSIVKLKSRKL